MSSPNQKKKRRIVASAGTSSAATEAPLGFSDIPSESIELVVSFLSNTNRINADQANMTLVSKSLRDGVEAMCEKEGNQIIQTHIVDSTFKKRIRDQDNIETTREKQVHLPFRYLTQSAKRTHLRCVFENFNADDADRSDVRMMLSPSEDKVAILFYDSDTNERGADVYSLSTKELLFTQYLDGFGDIIWLDNARLLLYANRQIYIWNETHDVWNSSIVSSVDGRFMGGCVVCNDEVFLLGMPYRDDQAQSVLVPVYAFSLLNMTASTKLTIDTGRDIVLPGLIPDKITICDNKWLLISFQIVTPGERTRGFYVYNVHTNVQVHFSQQSLELSCVKPALDCSQTIFVYDASSTEGTTRVSVFKVSEHGVLSEKRSFTIHGRRELLVAFKSRIVLADECDEDQLQVYNEAGELERTFSLLGQRRRRKKCVAFSTTRNELFVALGGEVEVMAYRLDACGK